MSHCFILRSERPNATGSVLWQPHGRSQPLLVRSADLGGAALQSSGTQEVQEFLGRQKPSLLKGQMG